MFFICRAVNATETEAGVGGGRSASHQKRVGQALIDSVSGHQHNYDLLTYF